MRAESPLAAEVWASGADGGVGQAAGRLRPTSSRPGAATPRASPRRSSAAPPNSAPRGDGRPVGAGGGRPHPHRHPGPHRRRQTGAGGIAAPAWAGRGRHLRPTEAWIGSDVYGDQEIVIVGFAYPGRPDDPGHTVCVLVDHNVRGIAKDAYPAAPPAADAGPVAGRRGRRHRPAPRLAGGGRRPPGRRPRWPPIWGTISRAIRGRRPHPGRDAGPAGLPPENDAAGRRHRRGGARRRGPGPAGGRVPRRPRGRRAAVGAGGGDRLPQPDLLPRRPRRRRPAPLESHAGRHLPPPPLPRQGEPRRPRRGPRARRACRLGGLRRPPPAPAGAGRGPHPRRDRHLPGGLPGGHGRREPLQPGQADGDGPPPPRHRPDRRRRAWAAVGHDSSGRRISRSLQPARRLAAGRSRAGGRRERRRRRRWWSTSPR